MCSNATATFTPNADLSLDSFTATLTTGVTDLAGNPLASNYQWGFSTTQPWTQQWGTTSSDLAYAITSDSTNNVYVAGETGGALDGQTSAGLVDIFVTKYNAAGAKQWTQQLGTGGYEYGFAITSDSSNNVYVAGQAQSALDGQTATGGFDLFITKYNASGVKKWTRQWGTNGNDVAYGITSDSANNVYITGYAQGGLDGQGGVFGKNIFVTKYNTSGVKQWSRLLAPGTGSSITSDSNNNVYVAGGVSNVGQDITVFKYNASGTEQWTRTLSSGNSGDSIIATGMAADGNDNIYVTGYAGGGLDGQTSAGGEDLFVTKYNASGTKQWSRLLGTSTKERAYAVATDSTNNIYVSGSTDGALDGQTSAGSDDLFVTKYNASGIKQWTRQLGTSTRDLARGITTDSADNVYMSGFTNGALDGQVLVGGWDIFTVKYASDGTKQ